MREIESDLMCLQQYQSNKVKSIVVVQKIKPKKMEMSLLHPKKKELYSPEEYCRFLTEPGILFILMFFWCFWLVRPSGSKISRVPAWHPWGTIFIHDYSKWPPIIMDIFTFCRFLTYICGTDMILMSKYR